MYKTIEDINKGYKKKDFKPTELVSEYLSKIKLKDQKLNSYTEVLRIWFYHMLKILIKRLI